MGQGRSLLGRAGTRGWLAFALLVLAVASVAFVACTGHDCTDDGNCTQAPDGGGTTEGGGIDGSVADGNSMTDAGPDGADAGPPKIVIDRMTFDFGTVETMTKSAAATFTLTNAGGASSAALAAKLTGANAASFTADATGCSKGLAAGESCAVTVVFAPTAAGLESSTLTVSANGEAVGISALTGTGAASGALTVTPLAQDFGVVVAGSRSADQSFLVTNTGATATGALAVTITGTDGAQFKVSADGCGTTTLAAGATCTVSAHLAPTVAGARSASLAIAGSPGGTATAPLAGVGAPISQLTISPTSFTFAGTQDGTDGGTQDFTVTNTGLDPTGVMAATIGGTNGADFKLQADGCSSKPLMSGASCTLTVAFAPAASGPKVASVSVGGTPGGAAAAGLSGTGLPGASLKITPSPASFGTVIQNVASTVTLTVTNTGGIPSGTPAPSLGGANAGELALGTNTCTGSLAPNASCTIAVAITANSTGMKTGTLTMTAAPGGAPVVTLTATAVTQGSLTISPGAPPVPFDFGPIPEGSMSTAQTFTVTNTGGSPSGVPMPVLGGAATQFAMMNSTCTAALPSNGTCTIDIKFVPTVEGSSTASLTVNATPGGPAVATVTGFGQSPPSLAKSGDTGAYVDTVIGTQTVGMYTVTNNGDLPSGPMNVSVTTGDTTEFPIISNGCTGTLAGHTSCTVEVDFKPLSKNPSANKSSQLSITATPPGANFVIPLSGKALADATLVVTSTNPYPFGPLAINVLSAAINTVTIKNTGDVKSGPLAALSNNNTNELKLVAGSDGCSGVALNGGVQCTVKYQFQPSAPGARTATVSTNASPGGSVSAISNATGMWLLTVNRVSGNAQSTISTNDKTPGTINLCNTASCTGLFADGASFTIQARVSTSAGAPYYHFSGWSGGGGCTGSNRDCVVTMNAPRTITANFSQTTHNLMFITNASTYTANMHNGSYAKGYDADCNTAATNAGINPNGNDFIAWLSDNDNTAPHTQVATRLTTTGGFMRLDDRPFALSKTLMSSAQILNPPNITETGALLLGDVVAWSASNDNGSTRGSACTNWTVNTGGTDIGRAATGPSLWTAGYADTCAGTKHLYCFQNTFNGVANNTTITALPAPVPSATVRIIYYSTVNFTPAGAMTANQICNGTKPLAGITTAVALQAANGVAPGSTPTIISPTASYYRPDGTFIATGATLAAAGQMDSGWWQNSSGGYSGGEVRAWTGSPSITTAGDAAGNTDCTNWGSTTGNGTVGEVNSTINSSWSWISQACTGGWPVVCVQTVP